MANAQVRSGLGARLKSAREYRGLSQDEVARHIQVSRSAVSLMERGTRNVTAMELSQLATLYKTSMESLAGEPPHDTEPVESVSVLARATAKLSRKDREEVLRFAEFLRFRSTDEQA